MHLSEWGNDGMTPSEVLTAYRRSTCAQACIGDIKVVIPPLVTLSP